MTDLTGLVESMKKIALGVYESCRPMDVQFGVVVSEQPLNVRIAQKWTLSPAFLLAREGETRWKQGDELILLRCPGGQRYLIYGKRGEL